MSPRALFVGWVALHSAMLGYFAAILTASWWGG